MKKDRFPGATYTDARLDGKVAVLFPNGVPGPRGATPPFIQLRERIIGLPFQDRVGDLGDLPLYLRVTPDGEFKIAAQDGPRDDKAPGKGTLEWTAEKAWQIVTPVSYGINATIYRGQELIVGQPQFGSQGLRYVNAAGVVITGDMTVNDQTEFAQNCGVARVWEWTQLGDITVGQGDPDGCIAVCRGKRYVLEPGFCTFIRFNSDGENCVVSLVKPEGSVICWFTRTELLNDFFPQQRLPMQREPGPINDTGNVGNTSGPKVPDVRSGGPLPSLGVNTICRTYPRVQTPSIIINNAKEPHMLHVDITVPLIRAVSGTRVDNHDGTISIQQLNGAFLCVTPDGKIEERPTGGGPWEQFKESGMLLVAERNWDGKQATYILPLAVTA